MTESRRRLDDEQWVMAIAAKAGEMAAERTLTSLGFDMRDPVEVQKDIAFLARSRKKVETAGNAAWGLLGLSVFGGALSALWVGLKKALTE